MPPYPYIYVNTDGTARELHAGERAYLETEFKGGDGAMAYIKDSYEERNGWGEINGFLERAALPAGMAVADAPVEDLSRPFSRKDFMEWLSRKGAEVTENSDGSFTARKPRR